MKISILTLFPEMFQGPFDHSIVKRAQEKGLIEIEFVNIRQFGIGSHHMVDDTPYGGGIGMVLRVDVLYEALQHTIKNTPARDRKIILTSAQGRTYKQVVAKEFAQLDHLIIICGHYEGIDERVKAFIDEEVSIGDFILTGGELATMLIVDSVVRLIPGVLKEGATDHESFSIEHDDQQLLEYPHYTKPQTFQDMEVPEVLLSGDHAKIDAWRREKALEITTERRPDLLKKKS